MESPEVRPHFTLYVGVSAKEAIECLRGFFETPACAVHGWVTAPYAEFRMTNEQGRFWAPRLSIYAEDTRGGAHLMCRLGPKPDVWTLYLAGYASLTIGSLLLLFVAYSKWTLDEPFVWPIVGAVVSAMAIGMLYVSAFVGQQFSRDDMRHLHGQLLAAFEGLEGAEPVEVEPLPRGVV